MPHNSYNMYYVNKCALSDVELKNSSQDPSQELFHVILKRKPPYGKTP